MKMNKKSMRKSTYAGSAPVPSILIISVFLEIFYLLSSNAIDNSNVSLIFPSVLKCWLEAIPFLVGPLTIPRGSPSLSDEESSFFTFSGFIYAGAFFGSFKLLSK